MIFNEELDKSLWLMLVTNDKKKEDIIDFLKDVPQELYDKIKMSMLDGGSNDVEEVHGSVTTPYDMLYWYTFHKNDNSLGVGSAIICDDVEYSYFQLTLYPLSSQNFNKLAIMEKVPLGIVTDSFVEEMYMGEMCLLGSQSTFYDLMRKTFGNVVIVSLGLNVKNRGKVYFEEIPEDYSLKDLEVEKTFNRLVRGRKKKFK